LSPRIKMLFAVALALAASLSTAPHALAARGMEIALQDDSVMVYQSYYSRTKALQRAQQLHVTRIRANVSWTTALGNQAHSRRAPRNPQWSFGLWDGLVDEANSKGIAVQLALTGPAPAFATSNHRIGPRGPKASYYRQFVKAAAEHFAGRVDRYSIWNEPNYVGWIAPLSKGPKLYRALYTTGYKTIKQVDPSARVLFGETSPYFLRKRATAPLSFLRRVACAKRNWKAARHCPTLLTDGYAHHPYDFDHAPTYRYPGSDNVTLSGLSRLNRALRLLARNRLMRTPSGGAPYLYLTEYGFFSSGHRRVSRSRHAAYLVKGFKMAQRNPRVKEMLQYLLVQPSRTYRFFDTSIANRRGAPYKAFTKLAAWARGAVRSGAAASKPVRATRPSEGGGGGSTSSPPSNGGGGSGGAVCPNLPVQPPAGTPCP
jgi:hypothetical protein